MHRHKLAFSGSMAIILILLATGFYAVSQSPIKYDFPLVRDIEKKIETLTNSTGSMVVDDFVEVTDAPGQTSETVISAPLSEGELPATVAIEVPFVVQAPTGNWDVPYQEACEEASLIMVHHFLDGTGITPAEADAEILSMVEWENEEFNYSADVTIEELKQIAENYYKHQGQLFYDFTIEDMKRLLAEGHPIIVPLAGRDIGNPYYSGEGPWYHMLVVTGYDGNQFITNDPGTKRGQDFRYPMERLYDAIHNWTGQKEDIRNGGKVILVLEK